MKEGLFGGTFNPVHLGHLKVISHVREAFSLDRVYLIPSSMPPHKKDLDLAPAGERHEMVKRSIRNIPGLTASDVELVRQGPSFTIDTLDTFQGLRPQSRLYFIMGSDAFFDIGTWKEAGEIFTRVPLIIMNRAGDPVKIHQMARLLETTISRRYIFQEKEHAFRHPELKPVHLIDVPKIRISSTMIRQYIKQGRSISSMVPEPAWKIIKQKGLYL